MKVKKEIEEEGGLRKRENKENVDIKRKLKGEVIKGSVLIY